MTKRYKHMNHHHELTDEHEIVDYGDGEFVANKVAIPLLKALNEAGLRTRTHHMDSEDHSGFVSILLDPGVTFEVRLVHERDSTRDNYDGEAELLISWGHGGEA